MTPRDLYGSICFPYVSPHIYSGIHESPICISELNFMLNQLVFPPTFLWKPQPGLIDFHATDVCKSILWLRSESGWTENSPEPVTTSKSVNQFSWRSVCLKWNTISFSLVLLVSCLCTSHHFCVLGCLSSSVTLHLSLLALFHYFCSSLLIQLLLY